MEQIDTGDSATAEYAPSFFDRIKRIFSNVGVFFDVNGYKKEIDRYESELDESGR